VLDGAEYLARTSREQPPWLGHRVVVIGGGSAALDAARSARRAGHAVTILALEAQSSLPAQREEVTEALEEGIALVDASMLRSVAELGGAGLRLHCVRVGFVPGARRGEFTVTPVSGSDFALEADAIVSSIGQDPELEALGADLAGAGPLLATDADGATRAHGVWAGGDLTSMARFVTEAVGMGERAALAIHRRLQAGAEVGPAGAEAVVPLASINLHYHPAQARPAEQRLAVAVRLAHSGEVQLGLDLAQALAETVRCFSCGTCTHCDNCVNYCPDLAVQPAGNGYRVLTDYCKGCGLCVKECPTGSMAMQEEMR
jgi:Pyruvate/2-oxoacid:ferredoxin oxidoreductase delta subunit/pyruvate/2-oxoglutarate dehydrogenase complex dihydrolipoamide dehydrogenase (E3) component